MVGKVSTSWQSADPEQENDIIIKESKTDPDVDAEF
jgi:hypothetical protein